MKFHGILGSYRVTACLMVMDACGVECSHEWYSLQDIKEGKLKHLTPTGKSPVLETPEGPLFETMAIIRHTSRVSGKLGGSSEFEQAQIDQWLSWANAELDSTFAQFLYQTWGLQFPGLSYKSEDITKGKEVFLQKLAILNSHLQGRKSVVGSDFTIADYALAGYLYQPMSFCLSDKERNGVKDVLQWLEGVSQTSPFKRWIGRLRYCAKPFAIPQPAKEETKDAKPAKAAGKAKEEKPKAKEEKPKAKEEDDDVEKPPKIEEPKFPDTNLNLMNFKTSFINEPDLEKAMNDFWKEFKEGEWSLWHLKYIKYPGECEVVYRTNNLLRTFFGTIEHIRKYLFGTHLIIGDEPTLDIQGVWLIRGSELFDLLKDIDSFDTYTWTKLDSSKEQDRALVKEFWTRRNVDEEKVQGQTIRSFKWIK